MALARTGFKKKAYQRKPMAAPVPVRKVAATRISDDALAVPKSPRYLDRNLLDMARGQECLLCVPGVCQGGTETTVAAHSNWADHGKAGARKAHDIFSVWSCAACHIGWLDQGKASSAEKRAAFEAGHARQVIRWKEIAASTTAPARDIASARAALVYLTSLGMRVL